MINGREYDPVIRITPPGPLRPNPTLLQQEVRRHATPPPPSYDESEDPYGFDESDEGSDGDVVAPPQDDRCLEEEVVVPEFWGVVRVEDFNGVEGQHGLERDNTMRNMLSRNAYVSRMTNTVYVGDSAREASSHERTTGMAYTPHNASNNNNNQVYVRARRGLPLTLYQVKQLRTMYRDGLNKFQDQQRVEAYLLITELYNLAIRVTPEHRDRAMAFLLEPRGYNNPPPRSFPMHTMMDLRPIPGNVPPRQEQPPAAEGLARLDIVGLYLLNYHRPGHFSQLGEDFKRCHLAIYVYISNMLFDNTAFWQSGRKLQTGKQLQKDRKAKKKKICSHYADLSICH